MMQCPRAKVLEKALKNRGYSQNEIEMVTYKNFVNFYKRVEDK